MMSLGADEVVLLLVVFFSTVKTQTPSDQLTCPSQWKDGESQVFTCDIQVSGYTNQTCKQFPDLVDLQFTPKESNSPSSICTVEHLTQSCDGQFVPKGCRCKEKAGGFYSLEFVVPIHRATHEGGTWRCVPACADDVLRNRYLHPPYAEQLQCGPVSFEKSGTTLPPTSATTGNSSSSASLHTLYDGHSEMGLVLTTLAALVVCAQN